MQFLFFVFFVFPLIFTRYTVLSISRSVLLHSYISLDSWLVFVDIVCAVVGFLEDLGDEIIIH